MKILIIFQKSENFYKIFKFWDNFEKIWNFTFLFKKGKLFFNFQILSSFSKKFEIFFLFRKIDVFLIKNQNFYFFSKKMQIFAEFKVFKSRNFGRCSDKIRKFFFLSKKILRSRKSLKLKHSKKGVKIWLITSRFDAKFGPNFETIQS